VPHKYRALCLWRSYIPSHGKSHPKCEAHRE
jgi:hypothetical protein